MFNRKYFDNFFVKSKRIVIKRFKTSEINARFINYLNNKELFKFSRHKNIKHTFISSLQYCKKLSKNTLYLSIKLNKNSEKIGTMTLYFKKNFLFVDVGILIFSKKYMAKGYGMEAWINVLNYLENKIKIRNITGGCEKKNIRMINLFKKSDMKPIVTNSESKVYFIKKN
jgi:RimJ/RimL family protein N-acetyltransferase